MSKALTKDLISDTSRHHLELLISSRGIDIAVFAPAEDNSLIYRHVDFDSAAKSTQDALEEAVYDNPLLLSQFKRIDCMIDTERFLIVPAERVGDAPDMLASLYGDDEFETLCDRLDNAGATLASAVPRRCVSFLKRTFGTPRITHRLTPLFRYFGHRTRFGNAARLHVHLREGACDIMAVVGDNLIMANSYKVCAISDVVYFTLAVAESLEFDSERDRVLISGDTVAREELMTTLRRYLHFVMPMIFPSDMLRIGRNAMDAPFELIAGALTQ